MKRYLSVLLFLTPMLTLLAQKEQNVTILTDNTQLTMQVKENGRLYQTYLGKRLYHTPDSALNMPLVDVTTSNVKGNEVYPVQGTEDYYEGALALTHSDGHPTSVLTYTGHEQVGDSTVIHLQDKVYPVSVNLYYVAYPELDIIRTWTEITLRPFDKLRTGHPQGRQIPEKNIRLSSYASSMLYVEARDYWLRQFHGDWAREMQLTDVHLEFGKKILYSSLVTRSAMYSQPYFALGIGNKPSETEGTVLMGAIGWTGNHRFCFEVDHNNQLRIISGIDPGNITLTPNSTFSTPEFVFTLSANGLGEGSRRFQRWMMQHRLHNGMGDRMTLLNNWENTYFRFDEEKIRSLEKEADTLGVDLFVLDDGWFGSKYPRNNDRQGLGDWQTNRKKLPNGIKALISDKTKFGIWIEPEMVSPKSELAERHPDWLIQLPKREPYTLRYQQVLDLPNPRVQDFCFSVVDNIMKEAPEVKYMKWDCNSPMTNAFSPYLARLKREQSELSTEYTRAFYRLARRVREAYPDLTLMLCASGGSRCDVEALRYFDEYWTSDDTDPVERIFIQWGASYFLPAKAMCAHLTNWNKTANVKFRTDVAFSCKLGFDIALNTLSAEDLAYCQAAVREWNRLKPLIFSPNIYRLVSPYPSTGLGQTEGNHCVMERVSDDKSHALIFAYDIHPRFKENLLPVKLQGLNPEAIYSVKEILMLDNSKKTEADNRRIVNGSISKYSGEYLMNVGLKCLTYKEYSSRIIELVQE